jgi:hypothetical protein
MKSKTMTLSEVRNKGFRALSRELGPYNFVRFLQQFEHGAGDYTKARGAMLDKWSASRIAKDLKSWRK